jgi:hypothetical protein
MCAFKNRLLSVGSVVSYILYLRASVCLTRHSAPVICEADSQPVSVSVRPSVHSSVRSSVCPSVCPFVRPFVRLSVRLSVRSSICSNVFAFFFIFFFWDLFFGIFLPSLKLTNMKKQKKMGFAFLRKKKDPDLCFTCSKKSRPGKSDRKMG